MRKPPNYPACIDGNPWYERISNERLENMSTKNLLGLYRKYRTVNYGSICSWDNEDNRGPQMLEYVETIKRILDEREHIKRNTPSGDNITETTRYFFRKKVEIWRKKQREKELKRSKQQ